MSATRRRLVGLHHCLPHVYLSVILSAGATANQFTKPSGLHLMVTADSLLITWRHAFLRGPFCPLLLRWRHRHAFCCSIAPMRLLLREVLLIRRRTLLPQRISTGSVVNVIICDSSIFTRVARYCLIFIVAGFWIKRDNVPGVCARER